MWYRHKKERLPLVLDSQRVDDILTNLSSQAGSESDLWCRSVDGIQVVEPGRAFPARLELLM